MKYLPGGEHSYTGTSPMNVECSRNEKIDSKDPNWRDENGNCRVYVNFWTDMIFEEGIERPHATCERMHTYDLKGPMTSLELFVNDRFSSAETNRFVIPKTNDAWLVNMTIDEQSQPVLIKCSQNARVPEWKTKECECSITLMPGGTFDNSPKEPSAPINCHSMKTDVSPLEMDSLGNCFVGLMKQEVVNKVTGKPSSPISQTCFTRRIITQKIPNVVKYESLYNQYIVPTSAIGPLRLVFPFKNEKTELEFFCDAYCVCSTRTESCTPGMEPLSISKPAKECQVKYDPRYPAPYSLFNCITLGVNSYVSFESKPSDVESWDKLFN